MRMIVLQDGEQHWRTIGVVDGRVLLSIARAIRDEDGEPAEIIRVISARAAERRERKRYEQETR